MSLKIQDLVEGNLYHVTGAFPHLMIYTDEQQPYCDYNTSTSKWFNAGLILQQKEYIHTSHVRLPTENEIEQYEAVTGKIVNRYYSIF